MGIHANDHYRFINNFYLTESLKEPLLKLDSSHPYLNKAFATTLIPITLIADLIVNGTIDLLNLPTSVLYTPASAHTTTTIAKIYAFSVQHFKGTLACLYSLAQFVCGQSLLKTYQFLEQLPRPSSKSDLDSTSKASNQVANSTLPPLVTFTKVSDTFFTPATNDDKVKLIDRKQVHERAKSTLQDSLKGFSLPLTIEFVKPRPWTGPSQKTGDLDSTLFCWEAANGMLDDVEAALKENDKIYLFGREAQHDGAKPASSVAMGSPKSELQQLFGSIDTLLTKDGFNMAANIVDESTYQALKSGHLTPHSPKEEEILASQFMNRWTEVEKPCFTITSSNHKVYLIVGATLNYGEYFKNANFNQTKNTQTLQYWAAFANYKAEFDQALKLAKETPFKTVVYRPTCLGIGAVGHDATVIGEAFKQAALEFQEELQQYNEKNTKPLQIQVELSILKDDKNSIVCATTAGLINKAELAKHISPIHLTEVVKFIRQVAQFRDYPFIVELNKTAYVLWWDNHKKIGNIQKKDNFDKPDFDRENHIGIQKNAEGTFTFYLNLHFGHKSQLVTLPEEELNLLIELLPKLLEQNALYKAAQQFLKVIDLQCFQFIYHRFLDWSDTIPKEIKFEDVTCTLTVKEYDGEKKKRVKRHLLRFESEKIKGSLEIEFNSLFGGQILAINLDGQPVTNCAELLKPDNAWNQALTRFIVSSLTYPTWYESNGSFQTTLTHIRYNVEKVLETICSTGKFEIEKYRFSTTNIYTERVFYDPSVVKEIVKSLLDGSHLRVIAINPRLGNTPYLRDVKDPSSREIAALKHLGMVIDFYLKDSKLRMDRLLPRPYLEVIRTLASTQTREMNEELFISLAKTIAPEKDLALWDTYYTSLVLHERAKAREQISSSYLPAIYAAYWIANSIPYSPDLAQMSFEEFDIRLHGLELSPTQLAERIVIEEDKKFELQACGREQLAKCAAWLKECLSSKDDTLCDQLLRCYALKNEDKLDPRIRIRNAQTYASPDTPFLIPGTFLEKTTLQTTPNMALAYFSEKVGDLLEDLEKKGQTVEESLIPTASENPNEGISTRDWENFDTLRNFIKGIQDLNATQTLPLACTIRQQTYLIWYNPEYRAVNIQQTAFFFHSDTTRQLQHKLGIAIEKLPIGKSKGEFSYYFNDYPIDGIPAYDWYEQLENLVHQVQKNYTSYKKALQETEGLKEGLKLLWNVLNSKEYEKYKSITSSKYTLRDPSKKLIIKANENESYSFHLQEAIKVELGRSTGAGGKDQTKFYIIMELTHKSFDIHKVLKFKLSQQGVLEGIEEEEQKGGSAPQKTIPIVLDSYVREVLLRGMTRFFINNYQNHIKGFLKEKDKTTMCVHRAVLSLCPEAILDNVFGGMGRDRMSSMMRSLTYYKDDLKTIEPGQDAGGLSREFISLLSKNLLDGSKGRVINMDTENHFPTLSKLGYFEEKIALRSLGGLFNFLLSKHNRHNCRINRLLSEDVFKLILEIFNKTPEFQDDSLASLNELILPPEGNQIIKFAKAMTLTEEQKNLIDFYEGEVSTLDEGLKGIVVSDPEEQNPPDIKKAVEKFLIATFKSRVWAAFYIGCGMDWNLVKNKTAAQLSAGIQGEAFNPDKIISLIQCHSTNPVIRQKVEWLKKALLNKPESWRKNFIQTVTGAEAVTENTKIIILEGSGSQCVAHTCGQSIEIPKSHVEMFTKNDLGEEVKVESLEEAFILNLEVTMGFKGFDTL